MQPKERLICGSGNLRVYIQESPGKPPTVNFKVVELAALGHGVEVDVPLSISNALFISECLGTVIRAYFRKSI